MAPSAWRVSTSAGDAGEFHQSDPEPVRSATFHTVTQPTMVLGSAQPDDAVDRRVATALGVAVVRRRSGGGAVLLMPGEFVWLDLVVPAGDPLWSDDVSRAMGSVGLLWQDALADLGVPGRVHDGGLVAGQWGRQVCWASIGAGEVLAGVGAGKLVGVSQRRTRSWARFQTMVHLRWRPEIVAALVAAPRPTPADLAGAAATVPLDPAALRAALERHLP